MLNLQPWALRSALQLLLYTAVSVTYALYILMYPPRYRKASIVLLALPVTHAFTHMMDLTPNFAINDTFGRFLYIWMAHLSYEVTILKYEPRVTKEKGGWRYRLRPAYKVLFDRNHRHHLGTEEKCNTSPLKHTYPASRFLRYHIGKVTILYLLTHAWDNWVDPPTSYLSSDFTPEKANFFRRLPTSLDPHELRNRIMFAFHWCIIKMFFYEMYHSIFAVLFVGILRLDSASEWCMSLFGPLTEAYSVRRYWGKHWHNYIYHSFSAHIKVVTRGWIGLDKGTLQTRLVENTLVFVASGLMHTVVRRVQNGGDGDIWCITIWYLAQMVPMVIEGIVQHAWAIVKVRIGLRADSETIQVLENSTGYIWVTSWFLWSVPKYLFTSYAWEEAILRSKYPEAFLAYKQGNAP